MRQRRSGWADEAVDEITEEIFQEDLLDLDPTGTDGPIPGIEPPPIDQQMPIQRHPSRTDGQVWWIGATGGCGASTLARLDDPEGPDAIDHWPHHPDGQHVVIVARETIQSLTAAQHAAKHYVSGELPGIQVLALVTVPAHKGRPHPNIVRLLRLLKGVFPRHYQAEWHPDYMAHLDPLEASQNHSHQRLIRTIHRISKG